MTNIPVIYQDAHIVAVNKPSGLLVHRSPIDRHETRFALQCVRDQIGQRVYPVHRLDKPTSGVLLFALSANIAQMIGEQMRALSVDKTYHAIVRGHINESGLIDYALKEVHDSYAAPLHACATQDAQTHYLCLEKFEIPVAVGRYASARYSHVRLTPKSGRRHQLRRHMKHIFHPIVGDTTHGDGSQNRAFRSLFNNQRLLLHASTLRLHHPILNTPLTLEAAPPSEFAGILDALSAQSVSAITTKTL